MKRFNLLSWAMAVLLVVVLAPTTMAAGFPDMGEGQLAVLDNGREYMRWMMNTEYERVHLTLSTPCGVIERTYEAGEDPVFEIAELQPDDPTGSYNWQLRIEPYVDPGVREALNEARAKNDQEAVRSLRRKGLLPKGPFIQSGFFEVDREGGIVDFTQVEKGGLRVKLDTGDSGAEAANPLGLVTGESIGLATAEQVISGDLVVYNSICVGFDCPTNPSFGADTIRLQENNLRIHVDDTSTAASYPNQDWRLEFNSNANGGGEYFRVIDATANRSIMTIEANAPSHSLYVESSGELGVGTANPVLEVHAVSGDTPGLRLEQDVSSGFAAQVWDLAGNETSLFIRDATNGSTLPFRVFPGSASNSLVVRNDNVGVGTTNPTGRLHMVKSGQLSFVLERTDGTSGTWSFTHNGSQFNISKAGTGANEFAVFDNGNVEARGTITGSVASPSSVVLKKDFAPIDGRDVLDRLLELPIQQWRYKASEDRVHLGPFAEDFNAAFQVGDPNRIFLVDANGVALAAIQGLHQVIEEKEAVVSKLQARLDALEAVIATPDTETVPD